MDSDPDSDDVRDPLSDFSTSMRKKYPRIMRAIKRHKTSHNGHVSSRSGRETWDSSDDEEELDTGESVKKWVLDLDSPEYRTLVKLKDGNLSALDDDATLAQAGRVRGWLANNVVPLPPWFQQDPLLVEMTYLRLICEPLPGKIWSQLFPQEPWFRWYSTGTMRAPSSQQYKPSSFMALPLEIREKIYEYAMDVIPEDERIGEIFKSKKVFSASPLSERLPAIGRASRQTFYESTLVYLRRTRFVLDPTSISHQILQHYLARFPSPNAYNSIRSLEYVERLWVGYQDMTSLMLFRGLRHLCIRFLADTLTTPPYEWEASLPSKDEIQDRMKFGPIYELGSLKELVLMGKVVDTDVNPHLQDRKRAERLMQVRAFQNLFELLVEGFQKRGSNVKITMHLQAMDKENTHVSTHTNY